MKQATVIIDGKPYRFVRESDDQTEIVTAEGAFKMHPIMIDGLPLILTTKGESWSQKHGIPGTMPDSKLMEISRVNPSDEFGEDTRGVPLVAKASNLSPRESKERNETLLRNARLMSIAFRCHPAKSGFLVRLCNRVRWVAVYEGGLRVYLQGLDFPEVERGAENSPRESVSAIAPIPQSRLVRRREAMMIFNLTDYEWRKGLANGLIVPVLGPINGRAKFDVDALSDYYKCSVPPDKVESILRREHRKRSKA